jgi:hypothetical protein
MQVRTVTRLAAVLASMALAIAAANGVRAQAARPQPKIVSFPPPTNAPLTIGVMGEVRRPGCYALSAAPKVYQLVEACGGLTDAASPMIRILRGTRVVHRVALHAAANEALQAGDLVIVDPEPWIAPSSRPAGDAGAQLAFLGIADHPVIVKVHAEEARPEHILQMLGQQPDLVHSLKILHPPQAPRSGPQLSSGTVLLFDPRQVVASGLANLPDIIPCSLPEEPDIGAYGIREAYEERLGEQQARDQGPLLPPAFSSPDHATSLPPTPPIEPNLPARLSSSSTNGPESPSMTRVPFSGSTPIVSGQRTRDHSSSDGARGTDPKPQPAPAHQATRKARSERELSDEELELSAEANGASGRLSLWQIFIVIACAGLLVGVAFAVRYSQSRPAEAQPTDASTPSFFESIAVHASHATDRRAPLPAPHLPMQAFENFDQRDPSDRGAQPGRRFDEALDFARAGEPAARPEGRSAFPAQSFRPTAAALNAAAPESLAARQQRFAQLLNHEFVRIDEPLALPPTLTWPAADNQLPPDVLPQRNRQSSNIVAAADIRQFDLPQAHPVPKPHHRPAHELPVGRALQQLAGGKQ